MTCLGSLSFIFQVHNNRVTDNLQVKSEFEYDTADKVRLPSFCKDYPLYMGLRYIVHTYSEGNMSLEEIWFIWIKVSTFTP